MDPKVSILIPCYNAERWVAQSIESALSQTYPDKEVIVIDDGSTDSSPEIIRSFGDKIKWETGPNRGADYARNRLLELSQGKWLQYLDADDYLLPDKIKNQLDCIKDADQADVIYSQVLMEFRHKGRLLRKSAEGINSLRQKRDIFVNLARWCFPQTGGVLFGRKSLIECGGWKKNQPCCQEHELYLRLLMAGKKFVFCEVEGAVYRLVESGTLSRKDPLKAIKERMRLTRVLGDWLHFSGMLNSERQAAINISRFECARSAYELDREFADNLIGEIKQNDKGFLPEGNAAPPAYRFIYKVAGFSAAEKLARVKRKILSGG
ncbi:MAG: glycosyltransferase [Candidatus Omnitrophota bacterium]